MQETKIPEKIIYKKEKWFEVFANKILINIKNKILNSMLDFFSYKFLRAKIYNGNNEMLEIRKVLFPYNRVIKRMKFIEKKTIAITDKFLLIFFDKKIMEIRKTVRLKRYNARLKSKLNKFVKNNEQLKKKL